MARPTITRAIARNRLKAGVEVAEVPQEPVAPVVTKKKIVRRKKK